MSRWTSTSGSRTATLGADFVVVVASPRHGVAGSQNPGVRSEAVMPRDLPHSERETWTPKILPVVLPGRSVGELPHLCPRTSPTTTGSTS